MTSLKFGTSGLRALVSELTDDVCAGYARAFVAHMRDSGALDERSQVLIGRDLRASSERIAAACVSAIVDQGCDAVDCGELPTPALAMEALARACPAIMVTGSHIPEDRNGLKFYRPDGEIDKVDEAAILARLGQSSPASPSRPRGETRRIDDPLAEYRQRYVGFGRDVLQGMRIAVYQHSSVARDLLRDILTGLGAECVPVARSDTFIPVDTEALRAEDIELARDISERLAVDALVSTDGDADRPLVADENGRFLRGDVVGILTARWLRADCVVTPVTSTTATEQSGYFKRVIRTRVGSPYVIEGMAEAVAAGAARVVGFEANGGVLLGSDIADVAFTLAALPTRDAMLPVVAILASSRQHGLPVSRLAAELPPRFTVSDRLKDVPATSSGPFLRELIENPQSASRLVDDFGEIDRIDRTDGVRLLLSGGDIVHFRASGNAPELRCYVETDDEARSALELRAMMARLEHALKGR